QDRHGWGKRGQGCWRVGRTGEISTRGTQESLPRGAAEDSPDLRTPFASADFAPNRQPSVRRQRRGFRPERLRNWGVLPRDLARGPAHWFAMRLVERAQQRA